MFLRDLIVDWYGETTYTVIVLIVRLYPIWLPLLLGIGFWEAWVRYVRYLFFLATPTTLLEIKLPKTLTKSPVAMELAINGFYQTGGESTVIDRYWLGKTRAWFSMEIASLGGELHMYIWTRDNMRQIVEAHMYSQYPDIEIKEVDDYTKSMVYDTNKYDMWATNYQLLNADPLPIKTYIDYGLDKNPKIEYETDPMAVVLEVMNNIKPQEQIWLQFVLRAHKTEKRFGLLNKADDWGEQVAKLRTYFFDSATAENRRVLSEEENKVINGLQRSVQKSAFDTGIRVLYIANKGYYNNTTVTSLRGLLRPFSANFIGKLEDKSAELPEKRKQKHYAAFNSFKITDSTDTDYPWEDYKDIRMDYQKKRKLDAFKRRMFFYPPYPEKVLVMTSESLATMFHFPTASVMTPGLDRIQSKRGQAPSNLPV